MKNKNLTVGLLVVAAMICSIQLGLAQKGRIPSELNIEDVPQMPIDTIATNDPDTKIIIYTNNTWSFYRPNLVSESNELSVYSKNWVTNSIFSYPKTSYTNLPSLVELSLAGNLKEYHAPIVGRTSSKYGLRRRKHHNGVDIPVKVGEPIFSTFEGKVRYAQFNAGGYGYMVIIRHPNGLETWNAHLSRINVAVGDYVKCGEVIGFAGNTGRSYGAHLHFETRYQDQSFDPEFLIEFESGQLKYLTFALEKTYFNINSQASEILEEDDQYEIPLLADNGTGEQMNSEDILARIEESQAQTKAKPANVTTGSATPVYHTIVSGDMLGKIAMKHKVSIDQICKLNNINRQTTLRLGRVLRIK